MYQQIDFTKKTKRYFVFRISNNLIKSLCFYSFLFVICINELKPK